MECTAYIIPEVRTKEGIETKVMRSKLFTGFALANSTSSIAYQVEVDNRIPNIIKRIRRIPRYKTREEFYNQIDNLIKETNLSENKIEKFCEEKGLIPTRLIAA